MDVYKWATKLGPLVPGDLLLDCFELAREIRYTDMAASPYDFSSYGLTPVPIETPEGKAEYVATAARLRRAVERPTRPAAADVPARTRRPAGIAHPTATGSTAAAPRTSRTAWSGPSRTSRSRPGG